jgi:hypothetical protein
MDEAKFVERVALSTGEFLDVYRTSSDGVFGIDSSFLEHVKPDSEDAIIEPYNGQQVLLKD